MKNNVFPKQQAKEIKIETGIEIPDRCKYPFEKMKVGDSFLCLEPVLVASNASSWSINHHQGKWKFTVRKENNGTRIWRIK